MRAMMLKAKPATVANTLRIAGLAGLVSGVLAMHAQAMVPASASELTCPLTGVAFTAFTGVSSYYSTGRSLDFEPLVMGMLRKSPAGIPQCPDSGLPIYRTFSAREVEQLRLMVQTPEWRQRRAVGSSPYLVAYTKYVLGEGEVPVAKSLLSAVWSAGPENRTFLLGKAVEAWSHIADYRPQHDQDWIAAHWLRVDLNRQRGEFEKADYWIRDFERTLGTKHVPITDDMITLERRLIASRNSEPAAVPDLHRRGE